MAETSLPSRASSAQPQFAQDPHGDAESRSIAELTFNGVEVDWTAFSRENWERRSRELGILNRTLQVVMSKDDVALTALVAEQDPKGLETWMTIVEQFQAEAELQRAGAESFSAAAERLIVALTRHALAMARES